MPDEAIITQLEGLFNEIVELGAEKERTRMVPNLLVTNDTPTGFPDFIVVKDDRDGDNILATKVPGVIYATNDLVNVLFVRGGEAIAFQQGSQSGNSGIWEIVPGTSTDIVYAQGDVGIGKTIAPDATLEILDTAQAQLRLTHTEDTKFVDFTLDTNHDLTIKPSSTGQVILQPTTDSTDFFQVLDADGGNPVLNVDSTNERVGVGTAGPSVAFDIQKNTNGAERLNIRNANAGISAQALLQVQNDVPASYQAGITSAANTATLVGSGRVFFQANATHLIIRAIKSDGFIQFAGGAAGTTELMKIQSDGDVGIGTTGPDAKLDILDTSGAQLRLTHTDGSKFVDFTLDTNHDLTVKPSSTGQIILQPTTDSTDFFQVLDADGGNPVLNVDSTNERVGIGTATPSTTVDAIRRDASGTVFRMENTAGVATASFVNSAAKEWNFGVLAGAAGSFAITEVGVASQFFVAAGGNIGINGVSSPSTELDIGAGAMEFDEMTAPGAGAANTARLYAVDNGAGKTQLAVIFNTGAVQVLATQP